MRSTTPRVVHENGQSSELSIDRREEPFDLELSTDVRPHRETLRSGPHGFRQRACQRPASRARNRCRRRSPERRPAWPRRRADPSSPPVIRMVRFMMRTNPRAPASGQGTDQRRFFAVREGEGARYDVKPRPLVCSGSSCPSSACALPTIGLGLFLLVSAAPVVARADGMDEALLAASRWSSPWDSALRRASPSGGPSPRRARGLKTEPRTTRRRRWAVGWRPSSGLLDRCFLFFRALNACASCFAEALLSTAQNTHRPPSVLPRR